MERIVLDLMVGFFCREQILSGRGQERRQRDAKDGSNPSGKAEAKTNGNSTPPTPKGDTPPTPKNERPRKTAIAHHRHPTRRRQVSQVHLPQVAQEIQPDHRHHHSSSRGTIIYTIHLAVMMKASCFSGILDD